MKNQEKVWDNLYSTNLKWHFESNVPSTVKGKRVLELGVGTGKTLKALIRKKPKEIIAIDFSTNAIKESKKLESSKVKVIKANATKLPFKDDSFDIVICYYLLNNLLEKDRKKVVKEIKRVLVESGRIYFEDFAIGDFRQVKNNKEIENNSKVNKKGLICHFFNEWEVRWLFKSFKKIKIKTRTFRPFRVLDNKRAIISAIGYK